MSALLLPNEILSMTSQAARRLVEAGDGDCALLYLALLERGGDADAAQNRLRWPRERLEQAYGRLAAMELVAGAPPAAQAQVPQQPDRLPEYSRGDVLDAMEREPEFMGLYQEMQRLLNRPLSDNDLKSLYTIYDYLALPVEVILMAAGYTLQAARRQKNRKEGVSVRMPQVQKTAFRWKRLGIDTVERAEEYLRRQQQVDAREWSILSAVGVTERRPAVEKEREYIDQWVEMGVSDDLIRLAYERTVYKKKDMNWPYANKILQSWHQAGYTTPEQVKAGDRPPRRSAAQKAPREENCQPSAERIQKNADWLDQFLKEQEKGR